MNIYTHTYTHTYAHRYTHTHTYIPTHTHTYTRTYTHTYTHMHIHTYTYIHIHTHTCIPMVTTSIILFHMIPVVEQHFQRIGNVERPQTAVQPNVGSISVFRNGLKAMKCRAII